MSLEGNAVQVHRVIAAFDCGLVVNPLTVEAQLQSAIAFGLSAALHGKITFKDGQGRAVELPRLPRAAHERDAAGRGAPGAGRRRSPPAWASRACRPWRPAVANALFALTGKRARARCRSTTMKWTRLKALRLHA